MLMRANQIAEITSYFKMCKRTRNTITDLNLGVEFARVV